MSFLFSAPGTAAVDGDVVESALDLPGCDMPTSRERRPQRPRRVLWFRRGRLLRFAPSQERRWALSHVGFLVRPPLLWTAFTPQWTPRATKGSEASLISN